MAEPLPCAHVPAATEGEYLNSGVGAATPQGGCDEGTSPKWEGGYGWQTDHKTKQINVNSSHTGSRGGI